MEKYNKRKIFKDIFKIIGTLAFVACAYIGSTWYVLAAQVDLTINIVSDKANYTSSEIETYTVTMVNRGSGDATNSSFDVTVPNTRNATIPWNTTITCVASGGAVCPSSYTLPIGTTKLSGVIPTMPVDSKIVLTMPTPGTPASYVSGKMSVEANIFAGIGDTNIQTISDKSNIDVYIIPANIQYSTTIPSAPVTLPAPGNTQATYTVTIDNTGDDMDSIHDQIAFATAQGSGSASSLAYISGVKFNSITCTSATGGASCSNVVQANNFGQVISPETTTLLNSTLTGPQYVVAKNMPGHSSITLTVVLDIGSTVCSTLTATDSRNLSLTSTVGYAATIGLTESTPATPADNTTTVTTQIGSLPCGVGDLRLASITQDATQTASGVGPSSPYSYTVTYVNDGTSINDAINVPITFSSTWDTAGSSLDPSPTCVATGGAVCPTSYTISGSSATAIVPSMPIGSNIQVTYTGTSGPNSTTLCQPRYGKAQATITPPSDYRDTNYNPSSIPQYTTGSATQGNNAYQLVTQHNIGVPCAPSYDVAVTKTGPFLDQAGTILAPLPLAPDQWVYFKTSFTNVDPGVPLLKYDISDFYTPSLGIQFDTALANTMFLQKPGDPLGIPLSPSSIGITYGTTTISNSGILCSASNGAVCPVAIIKGTTYGNNNMLGWFPVWDVASSTNQPIFPVSGRLDFTSTLHIPKLSNRYLSGCSGTTNTTFNGNNYFSGDVSLVDPMGSDRTSLNDTQTVPISVLMPGCNATLAVSKTVDTPTIPSDGLVSYTITATNTSSVNLDLPHIVDLVFENANLPMTMSCVSTTGGAVCPPFTPLQGTKYLVDGSTRPIIYEDGLSYSDILQFDFVWGTPGAATMPPGSSVTFKATRQYTLTSLATGAIGNNRVTFFGDPSSTTGKWNTVRANATPTISTGQPLAISKKVTPIQALPGETVTFDVSVINYGNPVTNAAFIDNMSPLLLAANPTGFSNITCSEITAADNIFPSTFTLGSTPCPTFTSTATGITATIPTFAQNSGFKLTYTALAPAGGTSVDNIAEIRNILGTIARGDSSSQANFSTFTNAKLGNLIFTDTNNNGIYDAGTDTVLPGIEVHLYQDANGDGALDPSVDSLTATQTTGVDGTYLFSTLLPGTYFVTITTPQGYVITQGTAGVNDTSQINGYKITLATGQQNLTGDFGLYQAPISTGGGGSGGVVIPPPSVPTTPTPTVVTPTPITKTIPVLKSVTNKSPKRLLQLTGGFIDDFIESVKN